MNDVCVLLKEEGVIKVARIHKTLLNGFHDMRWYAGDLAAHPLMALFDGAPLDPNEAFDYGLLAIDRDGKWVGSFQGYMSLMRIDAWGAGEELKSVAKYALDADLKRFDQDNWGQLLAHPYVRLALLSRAYDAGAIEYIKAAKFENDAPWVSMHTLGLDGLAAALNWLDAQRKALAGGQCMVLDCGFKFAPDGWTIADYDIDQDKLAFFQALAARGFVEPLSDSEGLAWLARFTG